MKINAFRYENGKRKEVSETVSDEFVYNISWDGEKTSLAASPRNLEELVCGFLWSRGLKAEKIEIFDRDISVTARGRKKQENKKTVFDRKAVFSAINHLSGGSEWKKTGGVHAAYILDSSGTVLASFEDIGRRNTLYKAVGWADLRGMDLGDKFIAYTGRVSGDIVEFLSGVNLPLVVSRAAPLSRAIELGNLLDLSVAAFARDGRFTLYSRPERIL